MKTEELESRKKELEKELKNVNRELLGFDTVHVRLIFNDKLQEDNNTY